MTKLNSTLSRGFFDPITLGLYVPSNFNDMVSYKDDISTKTFSTFVHELTHYLQFYGSIFGYFNLLSIGMTVDFIEELFQDYSKREKLKFPLLQYAEPFTENFDSETFVRIKIASRFYHEELYGYSYSHFGRLEPIKMNKHFVFTSTLFLEDTENDVYPVTGELILENSACCNEILALSNHNPKDIVWKFIDEQYLSLPKNEQHKYCGISTWLGAFKILDLEPIIYFIVLNQPTTNLLREQGDYNLVSNTKKILNQYDKLRKLEINHSDNGIKDIVEKICNLSGLKNPFEEIQIALKYIAPEDKPHDTKSWITNEIFKWYLNNPYDSIYWQKNINKIINKIPILNIHFEDNEDETFNLFNVKHTEINKTHLSVLKQHHDYCEKIHIYWGLYNNEKITCPKFTYKAPNICYSCNSCGGIIPNDKIGDDCPLIEKYPFITNKS
jgi:hypothetical protein